MFSPIKHPQGSAAYEVEKYLKSPSMVCSPGRLAIKNGKIPIVAAPLASESQSRQGKLPRFIEPEKLCATIRGWTEKIITSNLDGVVFVGENNSRTHEGSMLNEWAFWAETAKIARELSHTSNSKLPVPSREDFQKIAMSEIKFNGKKDTIPLTIGGTTRHLFLTAMSPNYLPETKDTHPRYAPHYCIAVVTREAVVNLDDERNRIGRKILDAAFDRVRVPYNTLVAYVLPDRLAHVHPFANKALRIVPFLQQLDPTLLKDDTSLKAYIREFTKKMIETGAKTPYGEATDAIVLRHLGRSGILPMEIIDKVDAMIRELDAIPVTKPHKKTDGGCPFGFG